MNKQFYRATIITQGLAGVPILNVGYPPAVAVTGLPGLGFQQVNEELTSLSLAIQRGSSFLRRYQSNGLDCRLEVIGVVIDDANPPAGVAGVGTWDTTVFPPSGKALPSVPLRAMTSAEQAEQVFARVDTPDKGLTTRIHLSNRAATSNALLTTLGGDYAEDTEDKAAFTGEL